MDLDDVFDPKVMVAVAVTAAVTSPPVRKAVRKGAVYGMAGLLMAADRLTSAANSAAEGVRSTASAFGEVTTDAVERTKEAVRQPESAATE